MHSTAWNSFHLSEEQTDGFIVKDAYFWAFLILKLDFRNASVDDVHVAFETLYCVFHTSLSDMIISICAKIIRNSTLPH